MILKILRRAHDVLVYIDALRKPADRSSYNGFLFAVCRERVYFFRTYAILCLISPIVTIYNTTLQ